MGCGTSVLPDDTPGRIPSHKVRPTESWDSGVGYELGSKESSTIDEDQIRHLRDLPDARHLTGPIFADRRPLPPHSSQHTFAEKFILPQVCKIHQATSINFFIVPIISTKTIKGLCFKRSHYDGDKSYLRDERLKQ